MLKISKDGDGIFAPEKTLEHIGYLIESEADLQGDFPIKYFCYTAYFV
ncbi:hypothetical protein [Clostridium gasigenes]|nr:hypothetical protein [Clostridium gasigenes]MBU3107961.1 hypothetical protein [Clostridium gasigenes]